MKDKIKNIIIYSLLGISLIGTITNTVLICTSMRDSHLRIENLDNRRIHMPEDGEFSKDRKNKYDKEKPNTEEDKEIDEEKK